MGGGLKNKQFYQLVVNSKGLTLDKLHRALTSRQGYALHKGFAIHFNFNALGQIVSMTPIAFKEIRLGEKDENGLAKNYKHNTNWDSACGKFDENKTITYAKFNPDPDVVLNQMNKAGGIENYTGQLLWYSAAGEDKYSKSSIDPILEDVASDSEGKHMRLGNLTTNFMASQLLVTDEFADDDDRKKFTEGMEKFQGARNGLKIVHLERTNSEQKIELSKIDVQDLDKLHTVTTSEVKDNIRSNFIIPPVLVGDQVAGKLGPSQQEIQDACAYYNFITSDIRLVFEETYKKIFQYWHNPAELPQDGDYSILPLSYESAKSNEPLAVRIGPAGMTSLKDILTDATLSPEQKINTLIIGFGLTMSQATAMVKGTPIQEAAI